MLLGQPVHESLTATNATQSVQVYGNLLYAPSSRHALPELVVCSVALLTGTPSAGLTGTARHRSARCQGPSSGACQLHL